MAKFGEAMRGLTVFISDIRNCECPIPMLWDGFWEWDYIVLVSCPHFPLLRKVWERDWYCVWPVMCFAMRSSCSIILCFTGKSKEAERKRINKELANIRSKFKSEWSYSTALKLPLGVLPRVLFVYSHLEKLTISRSPTFVGSFLEFLLECTCSTSFLTCLHSVQCVCVCVCVCVRN